MATILNEDSIRESLRRFDAAFADGSADFFDGFAKDAKIFTVDRNEPINGRDEYRQIYGAALASRRREKAILSRDLQLVGDRAVVNQTARIVEGETSADVVQTFVLGSTDEGVKILHAHTALIAPETDADPVRVLHEKIATAMTASGVAQ
jgi:ketosteroid isomerase-like protein